MFVWQNLLRTAVDVRPKENGHIRSAASFQRVQTIWFSPLIGNVRLTASAYMAGEDASTNVAITSRHGGR